MYSQLKSCKGLLCLLLVCIASCSKKDSSSSSTNNNGNPVNVSAGTWTISSYMQRTENKTSLFSGYVFTFGSAGAFSAAKSGATTTGSWSYTAASSGGGYYGGTATDATYTFNIGTSDPLNRLNRTWNVSTATATAITLDNPEPADDEHIIFSKQ